MTSFLDIYQKTCNFLLEIFSGDFVSSIQKISHFQAESLTFLVIYHKNNLSLANFSNLCTDFIHVHCTFLMFLSKRCRYAMINLSY